MPHKTLLAIIACERDNALLVRNWPYLMLPGFDVLAVGTADGKTEWPEKPKYELAIGVMGKRKTPVGDVIWDLTRLELAIWKFFLQHKEYDSVCVVEADNIFTRVPPEHPGNGFYLVTQLPNYSPKFKTSWYASTPRWSDRIATEKLFRHGSVMFEQQDDEFAVSDRFPAWICQKHRIPWMAQPAWSPSAFTVDEADWVRQARAAISIGCYALHSVKTQAQLDAVKDLLPNAALCGGEKKGKI